MRLGAKRYAGEMRKRKAHYLRLCLTLCTALGSRLGWGSPRSAALMLLSCVIRAGVRYLGLVLPQDWPWQTAGHCGRRSVAGSESRPAGLGQPAPGGKLATERQRPALCARKDEIGRSRGWAPAGTIFYDLMAST